MEELMRPRYVDFEGFPYPFERIQFGKPNSTKRKPAGRSRGGDVFVPLARTLPDGKQPNGLAVKIE